jgi:hypothetical protein
VTIHKAELGNVQKLGIMGRDNMAMMFDTTTNLVEMQRVIYHRFEKMFQEQQHVCENLERALKENGTNAYVPEENPSTIARYLIAKLPSDISVSDEVAKEIAMMLMKENKADAVLRLSKETGLGREPAHEILTQVNVQRTKDDLLRSVRLS